VAWGAGQGCSGVAWGAGQGCSGAAWGAGQGCSGAELHENAIPIDIFLWERRSVDISVPVGTFVLEHSRSIGV